MSQIIIDPPPSRPDPAGFVEGGWWHEAEQSGRIVCDLCPRECSLKAGDRGFCFVRQNVDGRMKLTTWGKSTGFCIDPIEKKPLNHFYPGTSVLSFGTAGCNLGCQFCQNWDISKSREVERLSELATPEMIAAAAQQLGCRSVAFTYNDPIIWAEYAIDTARACRDAGIKSVAVTAGYISPSARPAFFHAMDAANVDLKAFTEEFYQKVTYSHLQPILDTLRWLKHESSVWFEITNLIIPSANDSPDEIRQMCDWVLNSVGPDVPIHFSAFHPDFRMLDRPRTPVETLLKAHDIATNCGLKYVYVGNVNDNTHQSTYCPGCRALLMERHWYDLGRYSMKGSQCGACGTTIAGHFDDQPGTWGNRRLPVRIHDYAGMAAKTNQRQRQQPQLAGPATTTRTIPMKSVQQSPELSATQQSSVHHAACQLVLAAVRNQPPRLDDPQLSGAAEFPVMGAFVTLKDQGQLRGCMGTLGQPMTLLHALTQSAPRAAVDDPRFPPVSASELSQLTLDVTLLFNFETLPVSADQRQAAVQVGKHGLRIHQGNRAGLLLPSVPVELGWDTETFLRQVCRKAGLPLDAWTDPTAHLQRFEGTMLEGHFERSLLNSPSDGPDVPVSSEELLRMAHFVQQNLIAMFQGAVPACFPSGMTDCTVDGIALQLSESVNAATTSPRSVFAQIQLRGGVPLQSTLLHLTRNAADSLRRGNVSLAQCRSLKVDLALFADPIRHGDLATADLSGVGFRKRALVLTESQRAAWKFDVSGSTQELLDWCSKALSVDNRSQATVSSFAVRCTADSMQYSSLPLPADGTRRRLPGVAGTFYPSDPAELAQLVGRCLGNIPNAKESWPAAMVPHAGLVYSGQIAAGVLKRIRIPDTVIVLAPKHTPNGVDWAVAPHDVWQIPGAEILSDSVLARTLAERIDGLQLDAAAHAREHAIEVELPLLARLAPRCRVVGITIGSGNPDRCRRFGQQLATVISELPVQPLLLISSDMNHFATDARNRELDELALSAMDTGDTDLLYRTVTEHRISMCGVLPAMIVMETLKSLHPLTRLVRCGYATSAEVSGDTSRVVGYAGMLLGNSAGRSVESDKCPL